jgi:hypothetical protein
VDDSFKYDLAFSFLTEDEPLVRRLDSMLQPRLTTFVYLDRQKEVVGTDGEATLNRIFGKEARTVCVLYRATWGETPFTRYEATAIKNRAHDAGYGFATFIRLDGASDLPEWMPKSRIWANASLSDDALAAILETRAIDAGAAQRVETLPERVARVNAQADYQRWQARFLSSEEGVLTAEDEANRLLDSISREAAKVPEFQRERKQRLIVIRSQQFSIEVVWYSPTVNSLNHAVMAATVYAGQYFAEGWRLDKPPAIASREFTFETVSRDVYGWREGERQFSTKVLAQELLNFLLSTVEKHISTSVR